MAISFEQLQSLLQQQQFQFEKSQQQLYELLSQKLNIQVEWRPEPRQTSQEIADECHRLLSLNSDPKIVDFRPAGSEPQFCHAAINGQNMNPDVPNQKPPTTSWNEGERHSTRNFAHKIPPCQNAHKFICKHTPRLRASSNFQRNRFRGEVREATSVVFRTDFPEKRKYPTVKHNNIPLSLRPETMHTRKTISPSTQPGLGTSAVKQKFHAVQNVLEVKGIQKLYLLSEPTNRIMSCTNGDTYPEYFCSDNVLERTTLHTWPEPELPWCWMHVDPGGYSCVKLYCPPYTHFLRRERCYSGGKNTPPLPVVL
ncbi:unnamed protein product [Dicrocoelium dendriticum]|nr:unnamed protein product [Dicrocoelium dendriticum]